MDIELFAYLICVLRSSMFVDLKLSLLMTFRNDFMS